MKKLKLNLDGKLMSKDAMKQITGGYYGEAGCYEVTVYDSAMNVVGHYGCWATLAYCVLHPSSGSGWRTYTLTNSGYCGV